jgi:hypothetical protein
MSNFPIISYLLMTSGFIVRHCRNEFECGRNVIYKAAVNRGPSALESNYKFIESSLKARTSPAGRSSFSEPTKEVVGAEVLH